MKLFVRTLAILILLPLAAFCGFGFLATFEPPGFPVWRIGYAVAGTACLLGAGWTIFGRRRS